ncbi:hypothetical protein F442_05068 [Phytophthora nicotianae P10297]|uniref:Uncharacterized protein n=1 Tax=Phytophthora nicotianae P10297 TaxID=1317064 RepID=W2ZQV3_PHYNI|nr:hypothetical protein F442_05068 [Phytophthora nicotianae P10297]
MTQPSGGTRALSIMQELRQLRGKVCMFSEKNRELAKALTTTKQELTKARAAKSTVFSDKVVEWMEARYKLAEVQDKATQCNFEDLDKGARAILENTHFEPDPPLSPVRNCRSTYSEPRVLLAATYPRASVALEQPMIIEENETSAESKDAMATISKTSRRNSVTTANVVSTNHVTTSSKRTGSQAGVKRRLRQRDTDMSYVEPKLNTKLRRGDYYGLGNRTGQTIPRPSTPRMISGTRCTKSACVPRRFGHQRSPFRSRRSTRPIKRISYKEPKLNTKLRQVHAQSRIFLADSP